MDVTFEIVSQEHNTELGLLISHRVEHTPTGLQAVQEEEEEEKTLKKNKQSNKKMVN
jgi:hypothetical protein